MGWMGTQSFVTGLNSGVGGRGRTSHVGLLLNYIGCNTRMCEAGTFRASKHEVARAGFLPGVVNLFSLQLYYSNSCEIFPLNTVSSE